MTTIPKRWTVKKKNDYWVVFDRGVAWDCFENLAEAHTAATKNAVADELYGDGGLSCLAELKKVKHILCFCGHDRDWHWTGRGCFGDSSCTCRHFTPAE